MTLLYFPLDVNQDFISPQDLTLSNPGCNPVANDHTNPHTTPYPNPRKTHPYPGEINPQGVESTYTLC